MRLHFLCQAVGQQALNSVVLPSSNDSVVWLNVSALYSHQHFIICTELIQPFHKNMKKAVHDNKVVPVT